MNAESEFNPFRISKYELDLLVHCSQSAADKHVLIFERDGDQAAMYESNKYQEKYLSYCYVWQVRFGTLWMQKIPWSGEVFAHLTDWYNENDPDNAPKVDSRLKVTA